MKTIYPNEKVKLTRGGRNADKITVTEFKNLIKAIYEKLKSKNNWELDDYEWNSPAWIFYFCDRLPKIAEDLKIDFDFENILVYQNKESVFKESDIKITRGGTPYLELWCGGDWEKGLIVYIYPSDNTLRAYIPTKGNNVRKDLKCVFGGESEMYSDVSRLAYLKKYAKESLDGEGIDTKENSAWCLEDFETRLGEIL